MSDDEKKDHNNKEDKEEWQQQRGGATATKMRRRSKSDKEEYKQHVEDDKQWRDLECNLDDDRMIGDGVVIPAGAFEKEEEEVHNLEHGL